MTVSVANWITYAGLRGLTVADDTASEQALVRGQDYITFNYVSRLLPQYDETLSVIESAVYEAAAVELATPNFFSKTYTPDEKKVLTQVGSMKWTTVKNGGRDSSIPVSTKIEMIMFPYIEDRDGPQMRIMSIGGSRP